VYSLFVRLQRFSRIYGFLVKSTVQGGQVTCSDTASTKERTRASSKPRPMHIEGGCSETSTRKPSSQ
jgi:hypothetical protein